MFLWFRCDEILPGTATGVAFIAVAFGFIVFTYEIEQVPGLHHICSMSEEAEKSLNEFKEKKYSAFVLGHSGEVGRELVKDMKKLKAFNKVYLIGRRSYDHGDLGPEFETVIVDFDDLDNHAETFKNVDYGFSCLGTTRAKAGVKGFVKVDHDYVLKSAELAKAGGCKHFTLTSSQGADKNSSFLYPKTKGQVEEALKVIHFQTLSIFRPGLLMCDRQESRPSEHFFRTILKPMSYFFPTAITVPTSTLARAMINDVVSQNKPSPVMLYENRAIHFLSGITKKCL